MEVEPSVCILLVRGISPEDEPIFAYVAVRADRLESFMEAQKSALFYPEDYGALIEAGAGEPSEEVRAKMASEYDFNHDAMVEIPDADVGAEISASLIAKLDVPKPSDIPTPGAPSIIDVGIAVNEELVRYFRDNPEQLRTIHPRRFEELVAELFRGFDYEVELTKKTKDGGVDVIAIRHAEVKTKYLIECKCPSIRGYVSVRPVRELLGVKSNERATKAILATTARFSREAEQFYVMNRWELELRDYHGVLEWIDAYLKRKS